MIIPDFDSIRQSMDHMFLLHEANTPRRLSKKQVDLLNKMRVDDKVRVYAAPTKYMSLLARANKHKMIRDLPENIRKIFSNGVPLLVDQIVLSMLFDEKLDDKNEFIYSNCDFYAEGIIVKDFWI